MRFLIYANIFLVALFAASGSTDEGEATNSIEPLTHGNRDRRFVGGRDTFITLFPHYVSLEYNGNHICGGAIISPIYVLTAARCYVQDLNKLLVHAGSDQEGVNGTLHHVYRFVLHDNYTSSLTNGNDIAVIEVVEAFELDNYHAIIEMFRAGEKIDPVSIVDISSFGNKVGHLQHMSSPVVPCHPENNFLPPAGTFCAGLAKSNVCSKDAGSPVTIGYRLAGVVSYATNCGSSPGVITEVASYRDWIWSVCHV